MNKAQSTCDCIIDNKGCTELMEAVYRLAIHDYCAEYHKALKCGGNRCSYKYLSAARFLNETNFGRGVLNAIHSLPDENIKRLGRIRGNYNSTNR